MTSAPTRRDPAEDRRLVLLAREGDGEAFAALVEAYERPIYHFVYRTLADREEAADAAQEAFVKAYRGLHTFRLELRFSTWLFAIAYHACCDRLKRARRLAIEEPAELVHPDPGPEDSAIRSDLQTRVQTAIALLPERYRSVITLYYLHDRSYEEVAAILSLPLGTVKTHLHRAKGRLRQLLESEAPA